MASASGEIRKIDNAANFPTYIKLLWDGQLRCLLRRTMLWHCPFVPNGTATILELARICASSTCLSIFCNERSFIFFRIIKYIFNLLFRAFHGVIENSVVDSRPWLYFVSYTHVDLFLTPEQKLLYLLAACWLSSGSLSLWNITKEYKTDFMSFVIDVVDKFLVSVVRASSVMLWSSKFIVRFVFWRYEWIRDSVFVE